MLNFVCQVFLTKFLFFFLLQYILYYKQIDTRLNDVKSLYLFFFLLLVTLHKFSRVQLSTIFFICYYFDLIFVSGNVCDVIIDMFFVRCLSQHKAAMICYRLFERELYSNGGHPRRSHRASAEGTQ